VSLGRKELEYPIINPNTGEPNAEIQESIELKRFIQPGLDEVLRQDEELEKFINKKKAEEPSAPQPSPKAIINTSHQKGSISEDGIGPFVSMIRSPDSADQVQTGRFEFASNNWSSYVVPPESNAIYGAGAPPVPTIRAQIPGASEKLAHKSEIGSEPIERVVMKSIKARSHRAADIPAISSEVKNPRLAPAGKMTMQVLRSSCKWSLGKEETESSIMNAYLDLIKNSRQFIYIENQFFISSTSDQGVKNEIVQCLVDRILKAHKHNEQFKVVIFMPAMPSFEEHLDQEKGMVMQFQIGLQNETISKAKRSLLNQLREGLQGSKASPDDYIMICSLRKWQMSPVPMIDTQKPDEPAKPRPITEIIYIHSKVLLPHPAHDCRRLQAHMRQCELERPEHARRQRLGARGLHGRRGRLLHHRSGDRPEGRRQPADPRLQKSHL
jgi:hypothetical protein